MMIKRYIILLVTLFGLAALQSGKAQNTQVPADETIFIFGGEANEKFVQYVADLTGKQHPRICYLPTASGDHEDNIKYWEHICKRLQIEPLVLKVWVSSSPVHKSFEEILLSMDAIVVGGGNTLNMLGIWQAQGIDRILRKALKQGVVLAGGSAGSICWFQHGISDSRPVHLSVVEGLGILPYSHCPHYAQAERKELYHQQVLDQEVASGYACDDLAGILFKNGKAVKALSQSDTHHSYWVADEKGRIHVQPLEAEILVSKSAIGEEEYTSWVVKQSLRDVLVSDSPQTPLEAFAVARLHVQPDKESLSEAEKEKRLNITVEKIFIYNDKLAGVVNDAYKDFYGLWYFYNYDGQWLSLGEDIGGNTLFESELTFREKAKVMVERSEKERSSR